MQLHFSERPASTPLRKPWKNAIAVGRAYELLRQDVLEHLRLVQKTIGYRHCRFHGLFHDEMAVVARRKDGALAFRWHQIDKIYDSLLALGLKPFVELNGMPVALASGTQTIFDWRLNVTPPTDYAEWGQLVEAFARHLLDRYGLDEISTWYFEVWNEPNLGGFWSGTKEEYWKLYDASAHALKRVDPSLRVGGPASSKASWITDIIDHCVTTGAPIDFVSTHLYPQDEYVDYRDREGSPHALGDFFIDTVHRVQQEVKSSALPHLEIHWTEWNSLSTDRSSNISWTNNPSVDSVFGAALVCDVCTRLDNAADTLCWWVATDIFEESGMPQSEFSRTYGLVTINGLPKATFHAFEFLNRLRGSRLALENAEPLPPGCGLHCTREGDTTHVLLWHRRQLELDQQPNWQAELTLPDLPTQPLCIESRIRPGAGSAWETWNALGSPQTLSPAEMRLLRAHAQPEVRLIEAQSDGMITLRLDAAEVLHLEIRPKGQTALPKTNLRDALALWEKQMGEKSK